MRKAGDRIKLGSFTVDIIRTSHSIADAVALAFHTPVGVIVHTGDFKIDYTPIDGQVVDFAKFAKLGEKGVLALLADSTNVERPGYTLSERVVGLHSKTSSVLPKEELSWLPSLQIYTESTDNRCRCKVQEEGMCFRKKHGKCNVSGSGSWLY